MMRPLTMSSNFCRRMMTVLLAAFFLSVDAGRAQDVAGRVTDEAGRALPGAEVVLRDDSSQNIRYGTTTAHDGTYRFAEVDEGGYLLTVHFVGYARADLRVRVSGPEELRVDVAMQPSTISQEEVVVTATRARRRLTPITFSNLGAKELEEQPAMKDLPVLLASLPSITYHTENGNGIGYSTLRMRGFDQRRIAVSINGIPQNDPEDFNVFWINFFDIQNAVEDIQVQRGAGSSFYGPTAIGGAVNIVARPYKPYAFAEVEAGAGSYGTRRLSAEANSGLLADRYAAFARFSRATSDGYREWSWTEFYRFFAGIVRYGDRSTLTLQAYGGPQRDGLAFSGIEKEANEDEDERRSNFSALSRDVEHFHQPHVELLHDWRPSSRVHLHQALFWVKGEGYFDFGGTFRSADYLRLPAGWRGLSSEARGLPLFLTAPDASLLFRAYLDQWQAGWLPRATIRHDFGETSIGAEARLHRSLRWGRIQDATGLPEDQVGADDDVRVYTFRGEKLISSVYASHLFRRGNRYAIQADLQATYHRYRVYDEAFFGHRFRKPYFFVNPRLGITLLPEQPFSAYGSLAFAHREPRLKSLYDGEEAGAGFEPRFERDPDGGFDYDRALVSPERLLDLELGGSHERKAYRLGANFFWMEFWDEIVPSGGLDQFGVPRTGNADRTRHLGVEIDAAFFPAPSLSLFGNATISRNRFVSFTEYAADADGASEAVSRDGNPIAGFPERIANLGLRWRMAGWTARLQGRFAGEQFIDNSGGEGGEGFSVDPYVLANASLKYEPAMVDGLRIGVDVNNLLNDKVLLYGNVGPAGPQFFPTATRHVFLDVTYRVR